MISLHKCNGSCNVVMLSTKMRVPSETKNVNVKVLNMITRINEAKTLVKHVSCNFIANAHSIVKHVIQIKNGIMVNANVSVKSITRVKKIIIEILVHVFLRIVGI